MLALLLASITTTNPRWLHHNYPVKSVNLAAAEATDGNVSLYATFGATETGLDDCHPVYGVALPDGDTVGDGGYVYVGHGVELNTVGETGQVAEAWAVKLSPVGAVLWVWKSGWNGTGDWAIGCTQMPGGGDILVVGTHIQGGFGSRFLARVDIATGAQVWMADNFGDSTGSNGAFESIDFTMDGSAALIAGLVQKPTTAELSFRSYGNAPGGRAFVMKMPIAALTSSTAPTAANATWNFTSTILHTVKAARGLASGMVAVLTVSDIFNGTRVTKLTANGEEVWEVNAGPFEATDLKVSWDDAALMLSGHGHCPGEPGYLCGWLVSLSVADGSINWSRNYGSCGVPNQCGTTYILNECWGLAALSDGYILGCGTGIEGCDGMTEPFLTQCSTGPVTADLRPGALPRPAANWQSLAIRTNLDGELLWQRVDSWRAPADDGTAGPAIGQPNFQLSELSTSASEYALVSSDGSLVFLQDEQQGGGLLKMHRYTAPPPTVAPTAAPTSSTQQLTIEQTAEGSCTGSCCNRDAAFRNAARSAGYDLANCAAVTGQCDLLATNGVQNLCCAMCGCTLDSGETCPAPSGRRSLQSGSVTLGAGGGNFTDGSCYRAADPVACVTTAVRDMVHNVTDGNFTLNFTGSVVLGTYRAMVSFWSDCPTTMARLGSESNSVLITQLVDLTGVPVSYTEPPGCYDNYVFVDPPPSAPPITIAPTDDVPCFAAETTTACRLDSAAPVTAEEAFRQCYEAGAGAEAHRVLMSTLRTGDVVIGVNAALAGTLALESVVVNQHTTSSRYSLLFEISHTAGMLALTPDHMLLVNGGLTAARNAKVGTNLALAGGKTATITHVSAAHGRVVNPVTVGSTILAAGLEGEPVVALTHPEWSAALMRSKCAPWKLFYALSAVFPATTHTYYESAIEPLLDSLGQHVKPVARISCGLFLPAFIADAAVAVGLAFYACPTAAIILALTAGVSRARKP